MFNSIDIVSFPLLVCINGQYWARESDLGTKPPLSDEIWTAAFPLAVVQIAWINFGFRHKADVRPSLLNEFKQPKGASGIML